MQHQECLISMKWDYKIGDNIEFFDPEKSYELTGYRPINAKEGLDFDPDWFREDAIRKLSTGRYSGLVIGSKSHREFWKERLRRCEEGYEVNGYRITGDNYFWLNFYRLKTTIEGAKASKGRKLSFPKFLVLQYEYFHYVELCELLGKDVGLLKARALGFSEIAASLCARPYTTTPNYRVMASAYSERHLKPLLTKIWAQLDWLSMETETAFKRVRMVINTNMYKRASKKRKDGTEGGHMSEIEGVIADSAEKIRGDRVERLLFEEGGSDKVLKKKYLQGEALITVLGGERIGTRIVWGTGGDSGTALEGIKDIIINPDAYNILKYKHNHTRDGSYILSGMFIPAYRLVSHLLDKRGWCDPIAARQWYDGERHKKASDPKALLIYTAEYCYTIEEAVLQQGDNIFPREELAEQKAAIEVYKTTPIPKRGYLNYTLDEKGERIGTKWTEDPDGKILILEPPMRTEDNVEYHNLYVAGIDSIDIGGDDSSTEDSSKVSDFCIVIKKRVFGQSDPMYVAIYKDRPKDPRTAYEIAAKLLVHYNCKAVLESTRTAILTHFRNQKYLNLLMKRPRATMPDITKGNSNMYGTPASPKVINHYRELIYDFIIDYFHTIGFIEMVDQLLNYNDEQKKKFDIVAAMGMCELGDEELSVRKPEPKDMIDNEFRNIGWYNDSRGYKHYGIIPQTEEERNDNSRIRASDSWLYKELA